MNEKWLYGPERFPGLSRNGPQTTTPGTPCPTLLDKSEDSLTSPANQVTLKMQETGSAVYSPYPKRLKSFTGVITKGARSPQLFIDPECWPG